MNKKEDVQFSRIVLEPICPTIKPETRVQPSALPSGLWRGGAMEKPITTMATADALESCPSQRPEVTAGSSPGIKFCIYDVKLVA